MSENTQENTIRFQLEEDGDVTIWCGRTGNMMIDILMEEDQIFQIDITTFETVFSAQCADNDGTECRCFFEENDDTAEMDCPWGMNFEEIGTHTSYWVNLCASEKICPETVKEFLKHTARPGFGAPASIQDVFSFKWIFMDPWDGPRVMLDGGHVERPCASASGN